MYTLNILIFSIAPGIVASEAISTTPGGFGTGELRLFRLASRSPSPGRAGGFDGSGRPTREPGSRPISEQTTSGCSDRSRDHHHRVAWEVSMARSHPHENPIAHDEGFAHTIPLSPGPSFDLPVSILSLLYNLGYHYSPWPHTLPSACGCTYRAIVSCLGTLRVLGWSTRTRALPDWVVHDWPARNSLAREWPARDRLVCNWPMYDLPARDRPACG